MCNHKEINGVNSEELEQAIVCNWSETCSPLESNRVHISGSVDVGQISVYIYDGILEEEIKRTPEGVAYYDKYEQDSLKFKKTYNAGDVIDEWVTIVRRDGTIYCEDEIVVLCPTNVEIKATIQCSEQGCVYGWQRFLGSRYGSWMRKLLRLSLSTDEQV